MESRASFSTDLSPFFSSSDLPASWTGLNFWIRFNSCVRSFGEALRSPKSAQQTGARSPELRTSADEPARTAFREGILHDKLRDRLPNLRSLVPQIARQILAVV